MTQQSFSFSSLNILLFSCSVMLDSLWPHGLQHARLPCPSPSPRACSNSCLLSQWCHLTIWPSVVPFFSCLLSFPASGSFPMSLLFISGGQSIGASVSVLLNEYSGLISFRIDWFDLLAVQFSCSVMSDFFRPHGLQYARLPCPSPTTRAYSNSFPLSEWSHQTNLSSVIPFSSCLQFFPASGFFKWVSSSHEVTKVLEFQLQHQSFQWIFRTDFL